jgi:hypothetical protein
VRLAVAGQRVVGEDRAREALSDDPHGLGDAHRAALALADVMMTRPADLSDELVDELTRHFDGPQLLELTLDVMKWNTQKAAVALGVDDEVRPGELTDLVFDVYGNWVRPTG